jgi:hypothetical protein
MLIFVRKLTKYNLDLVAVQEVRWDNSNSEPADDYTFFYRNGNANHHIRTGIFIRKRIISGVTRVKECDTMLYITLR